MKIGSDSNKPAKEEFNLPPVSIDKRYNLCRQIHAVCNQKHGIVSIFGAEDLFTGNPGFAAFAFVPLMEYFDNTHGKRGVILSVFGTREYVYPAFSAPGFRLDVQRTGGMLSDGLFSILFLIEACGGELGEQITNFTRIGIIGNLRNSLLLYPHCFRNSLLRPSPQKDGGQAWRLKRWITLSLPRERRLSILP